MDKESVVPMHNGVLLSHWKILDLITCNNMDGSGCHYVKWNKPGAERQPPWFHIFVGSKTQNNSTHRDREWKNGYQKLGSVVGYWGGGGYCQWVQRNNRMSKT